MVRWGEGWIVGGGEKGGLMGLVVGRGGAQGAGACGGRF